MNQVPKHALGSFILSSAGGRPEKMKKGQHPNGHRVAFSSPLCKAKLDVGFYTRNKPSLGLLKILPSPSTQGPQVLEIMHRATKPHKQPQTSSWCRPNDAETTVATNTIRQPPTNRPQSATLRTPHPGQRRRHLILRKASSRSWLRKHRQRLRGRVLRSSVQYPYHRQGGGVHKNMAKTKEENNHKGRVANGFRHSEMGGRFRWSHALIFFIHVLAKRSPARSNSITHASTPCSLSLQEALSPGHGNTSRGGWHHGALFCVPPLRLRAVDDA